MLLHEEKLISLLSCYLEGSASEDELRELSNLLDEEGADTSDVVMQVFVGRLLRESGRGPLSVESIMRALPAGPSGVDVEGIIAEVSKRQRRSVVLRWSVTLAAAASILAILGILWLAPSGRRGAPADVALDFPARNPFGKVTRRVGDVSIQGNLVKTGPGAYCRVELDNRTVLALNQNSEMAGTRDARSGATRMSHRRGCLYMDVAMDVAKEKNPFIIESNGGQAEVVGTRLLLVEEKGLGVLDGEVRFGSAGRQVNAMRGQWIVPLRPGGQDAVILKVTSGRVARDALLWLKKLGIDPDNVIKSTEAQNPQYPGNYMDFDNYEVHKGTWNAHKDSRGVSVTQSNMAGVSYMFFGTKKWRKGVVSCRFRVRQIGPALPIVGFAFRYRGGENLASDNFSVGKSLSALMGRSEWFRLTAPFVIGDNNNMMVRQMEFWPEKKPDEKRVFNMEMRPENSRWIKIRDACDIGLVTKDCAVDFEDIRLTDAVEDK